MPVAFMYPRVRHRRTLTPGPFTRYQRYKPALRQEFSAVCAYCRTPDVAKGRDVFGVDHYLPKRYFKALENDYSNLYYCCNRCNGLKRDYYPETEAQRRVQFVPNPCDHVMFEHLRFSGDVVQSRSAAGQFTEELLELNDDDRKAHRRIIQLGIKQLLRYRTDVEAQIQLLSRKLTGATGSRAAAINAELERAKSRLAIYDDDLRDLGSGP